jgi:hypothetical protein
MHIATKVNIVLENVIIKIYGGCAGKARRTLEIADHLISLLPQGSLFSLSKEWNISPSQRDG